MDGIEAATKIHDEHTIPVIVVSAFHDHELIERAEADHMFAYLVKPIKQADMEPAITLTMQRFAEIQKVRKEVSELKQALKDQQASRPVSNDVDAKRQ